MSNKEENKTTKEFTKEDKDDIIRRLAEDIVVFKNLLWAAAHARDGVLVLHKEHIDMAKSQDSFVFLGYVDDPKIVKVLSRTHQNKKEIPHTKTPTIT